MTSARAMWLLFEPIHAVTYFSDEAGRTAQEAGFRGFWMGYFAQRAAPLGPVGPEVVTACFHGFHRSRVERALPDAWDFGGPAVALAARLRGVDRTLERLWGRGRTASAEVEEAADLLWEAAQAADTAGRALAAANRALPRPDRPHLALWQATTTLREHRGDGHVCALVTLGVSPVEAALVKAAAGEVDGAALRQGRAWPTEDWHSATQRLRERGWLDDTGSLTTAGQTAHREIEARTDVAAQSPWEALGPARTQRAAELLRPLVARILAAGLIPARNPIGVPLADQSETVRSTDSGGPG